MSGEAPIVHGVISCSQLCVNGYEYSTLLTTLEKHISDTTGYVYTATGAGFDIKFGMTFSPSGGHANVYEIWDGTWNATPQLYILLGQNTRNQSVYATANHSGFTLVGTASAGTATSSGNFIASYIIVDSDRNFVTIQTGSTADQLIAGAKATAGPELFNWIEGLGITSTAKEVYNIPVHRPTPTTGVAPDFSNINPSWQYDLSLPIIDQLPGVMSIHVFESLIYVMLRSGILLILAPNGTPAAMPIELPATIPRPAYGFRTMGIHRDSSNDVIVFVGGASRDHHGDTFSYLSETQVNTGHVYALNTTTGSIVWTLRAMPSPNATIGTEVLRVGQSEIETDIPLTDGFTFDSSTEGTIIVPIPQTDGNYKEYSFTFLTGQSVLSGTNYTGTPLDGSPPESIQGDQLTFTGNRLVTKRYSISDLQTGVTPVDDREFAVWGGAFRQVGSAPVTSMNLGGTDTDVVAFTQGGGAGKLPKFIADRIRKKCDHVMCELIRIQISTMETDFSGGQTRALSLLNEMQTECTNDALHPYQTSFDGTTHKVQLETLINTITNAIVWSDSLLTAAQDYARFCAKLASAPQFMSPYERRVLMCGIVVVKVSDGSVVMVTREHQLDSFFYPGFVSVDVADPHEFTSYSSIFKSAEPWSQQMLSYMPGYNADYAVSAKFDGNHLIAVSKLHVVVKVALEMNVTTFTNNSAEWTTPSDYTLLEIGARSPMWSTFRGSGTFRDELEGGVLYTSTTHYSPADYMLSGAKINKFVSQLVAVDVATMTVSWSHSFDAARAWQNPVYVLGDSVITTDAFGKLYTFAKSDGSLLQTLNATDVDRGFEAKVTVQATTLTVFGGPGWSSPNASQTTHPEWPSFLSSVLPTPENYGLVIFDLVNGSYVRRSGEVSVLIKNKRPLYDPILLSGNILFTKSAIPGDATNVLAIDATSLAQAWVYPQQAA